MVDRPSVFERALRLQRRKRIRRIFTLTRAILEKIAEFGEVTLDAFFPAKYPEARLWRSLLGLDARYEFRRTTFSAILARLRAQGLVERSGVRQAGRWRLTNNGVRRLGYQQDRDNPAADGISRLVIFDVPERERAKRRIIRAELIAAGYAPLQRSVWWGNRPLPVRFAELVEELSLRSRLYIFSVGDRGTLPVKMKRFES